MAQGVAWAARELGVPATVVAPDTRRARSSMPSSGSAAASSWCRTRSGGRRWSSRRYDGLDGLFVHPVEDDAVMAGNGTIGLELVRAPRGLRDGDRPVGRRRADDGHRERREGTAARRAHRHRGAGDGCAACSLAGSAGAPVAIDYQPSFVDGAGGRALLPSMWERAQRARRRGGRRAARRCRRGDPAARVRAHVVAEGAGALALAASSQRNREGTVVCIVSGGNIDTAVLARILAGESPAARCNDRNPVETWLRYAPSFASSAMKRSISSVVL